MAAQCWRPSSPASSRKPCATGCAARSTPTARRRTVADPKARIAALEARHGPAPRATLAEVADHIVYLVETAGIDHVGIGSDYYGGPQPVGLEHVGRFPHLFAELIRRGFFERDLEKIANRNVLRVMRNVERGRRAAAGDARAGGRQDRGLSGGVRAPASGGFAAAFGTSLGADGKRS